MPWRDSRGRRARGNRGLRAKVLRRDKLCQCEGCIACLIDLEEPKAYRRCERASTEADHIIPVAEGGQEEEENLAGKCSPCHKQKIAQEAVRGLQRHSARGKYAQDPGHPGIV